MAASYYYLIIPSVFGAFSILWRESGGKSKIFRIILSENIDSASKLIQNNFSTACQSSNSTILHLVNLMQSFLSGQLVKFDLNLCAFEICSNFQQRVLLAENSIPRGWVSTYGRIGKYIGVNRGARAVGHALACNPFPLIIPCHRAIRSDRTLGGYQGGMEMKRALLKFEGIKISKTGKVMTPRYYY
jgi:methylated-DNA-[protein]-cysteine S-methyltransferase